MPDVLLCTSQRAFPRPITPLSGLAAPPHALALDAPQRIVCPQETTLGAPSGTQAELQAPKEDGETHRLGRGGAGRLPVAMPPSPIPPAPSLTINRLAGPAETMVCLFSAGGARIGGLADLSKWSD